MKFASIDIETTGLDSETCDIVEFGAVLDDTSNEQLVSELPRFHAYMVKERYRGEPYALSMHPAIFKRIATREPGFMYVKPDALAMHFMNFLIQNGYGKRDSEGTIAMPVSLIAAGKNFGSFDLQFLKKLDNWTSFVKVAHRCVDPCMLFARSDDQRLPDMKTCLERAGLPGQVDHTAVSDAEQVVRLLRKAWNYGHPEERGLQGN